MSIPKQAFFQYIKEFKLKELFNDLGWDKANVKYPIKVDDIVYDVTGVAQKKDFVIFLCTPSAAGNIPDSSARKKIDNRLTPLHHEHLTIYVDGKKSRQHWELLIREQNKPVVSRPIDYYSGQEPELLFQKLEGLFFTFEDEEKLSIVDVRSRVMANFEKNAEVVTKKFYEKFSKEHEKFLGFIKGIQSKVDQEWYASLMLNRLMFIYFIQKKGFLDKNKDYLRTRLKAVQSRKGKDKFYSFYRNFLLVLFHKGLGSPKHDAALEAEIGKVPYLNGGLFDVHKLEHDNKDISIEDKAFERIFDFFDEYNWHLDTRITATGKDINPDVIGYIFEKYINDRAAMGAYYTKEDITEYISKNCIVPWLFDEVKRNYPKPFAPNVIARNPEGTTKQSDQHKKEIASPPSADRNDNVNVWSFFQQSGDTYIYPAVKHGIIPNTTEQNGFADLPEDVRSCIDPDTPDLVEKRKCWNRPAPSDIALPTEIYREVIARRKRYYEVRKKIEQGEITEINDFITYNLNIRQFAQDVLRETDDPKLIMEFYKAVRKITVLDPTCGSGAFLFAALNILEPLYFACVIRMREFVEEDGKGKHKFFEEQLALIDADVHPNEEYFIYKSIILHNLYGVDIMKEAVEIAKLRLFLKLVATCDVDYNKPNLGLEPLPDIDFNIRSGNTLVGYSTLADLDKGEQGGLFGDEEKKEILEQAEVVSMAYARFKDAQLVMHSDPKTYKDAKDELNKRLTVLNDKLNKYLAVTYLDASYSKKAYDSWLSSHQPFHWLAEYYTTIARGGFDVIIGNPPYTEIPAGISRDLLVSCYDTALPAWSRDEDLYTLVLERSIELLPSKAGRFGMILPLSLTFSTKKPFVLLRSKMMEMKMTWWLSHFDRIPSALFGNNIRTRNTIALSAPDIDNSWEFSTTSALSAPDIDNSWEFSTTSLSRWESIDRGNLFPLLQYATLKTAIVEGIPKVANQLQGSTIDALLVKKDGLSKDLTNSIAFSTLAKVAPRFPQPCVFVGGTAYNWFPVWRDVPRTVDENGKASLPARTAAYRFKNEEEANVVFALLASSMGYWWWAIASDGFNLKKWLLERFPISLSSLPSQTKIELSQLGSALRGELKKHYVYKDNKGRIGNYLLPACEKEIDLIDASISRGVTDLTSEFFENIRAFNHSFSRVDISDQGSDSEE
jgi:hypothetical protein